MAEQVLTKGLALSGVSQDDPSLCCNGLLNHLDIVGDLPDSNSKRHTSAHDENAIYR